MQMQRFRSAVVAWAAGGVDAPAAADAARAMDIRGLRTVVLVEGVSDRVALDTLAARRDRDLDADGVCVLPMGGAMSIGRFLTVLGPHGLGVGLAGLCDLREERYFRRGLERAGLGRDLTRGAMEALGFGVCVVDLEDELIRALGTERVERVVAGEGDLRRLRSFQNQPAQRERTAEAQLRRFMGTLSGRKERYARALVSALDPQRVPKPLDRLFAVMCPQDA
jgi:hypothetical protein